MITIKDIGKVEGIYESGFGDLNIGKVFEIGMVSKWYNRSPKNFDERSLELAKEEGILDIPKIKPAKIDDESVKTFYKELFRKSDMGKKFDQVWIGLTMSYFDDNASGIPDGFTGPRNSAFYCGRDMYELKSSARRFPAFSGCANNIIATFYEKADSREITDEFKKAIAAELVSPLTARSLNVLCEDDSENKNIKVRNPISWASRFMEDYKIAKPPIYDSLKNVIDFKG